MFKFDKIYILQSLKGEEATGDEVEKRIRYVSHSLNVEPPVELINTDTREEFFDVLAKINSEVSNGAMPFIHFEVHGSPQGFGLSNGESVEWNDIKEPIRQINIDCNNNLFISLATCFGGYLLGTYSYSDPCPFYGYIGPVTFIWNKDAEVSFSEFFETLLRTNDMNQAIDALHEAAPVNKGNYSFLNCHSFYDQLLKVYHDPETKEKRVANLMSLTKQLPNYKNASDELTREHVKAAMAVAEKHELSKWKASFFHQNIK